MTTRAYFEERGQHSVGSGSGKFGGPDTYIAVQFVPEGVERLKVLRRDVADRRGIVILYVGEGYHNSRGPRSMLGKAIAEANQIVHEHNVGVEL